MNPDPSCSKAPYKVYNIGNNSPVELLDYIATIENVLGKKAIIDVKPRRPGDQLKTHAIIDKARRVLGYDPKVMPQEGLRKEVEWFKEKFYDA